MKSTAVLFAVMAWFLSFVHSHAIAQQTIDFSTALQLARENNPDWRAAEQEIEGARGRLRTARLISPFNPAVEAQGGPRRMPGEGTGLDIGVGVSLEVELAGQRSARITEAEANLQKAEASFQDFARTFRGKLARAFYQTIFARERLALQRRVEDLNRSLVDVTKIRFDAGDVSGLEVNVAAVRYGQSRKDTIDASRNVTQANLDLARLIGVQGTFIPQDKLDVNLPAFVPAAVLDRALANRADLLARRHELRRAEAEIALVKREVLPNPIFGLSFNREGSGDKIFLGGVTIPLPIFNRRQGELGGLEARRIQARAELLALEKEIQKEVSQAINNWETARQSRDFFQREVIEQIDENFRLLEAAYRERRIDLPRLLIMENDLVNGNQSYLEILSSLREAAIQIEEVTGEVR